jgi:hypothetical protein
MPHPTASQCASVVMFEITQQGEGIYEEGYHRRHRLGKAGFPVA